MDDSHQLKNSSNLVFNFQSKISIIGGGIAGAAVALALQKKGFEKIHIWEKDADFFSRRQGYGLTIQQGIKALKTLGIYEQVYDFDTPSSSHYIFDGKGFILGYFGRVFYGIDESPKEGDPDKLKESHEENGDEEGGEVENADILKEEMGRIAKKASSKKQKRYNLHISRQNLRKILMSQLEEKRVEISWGKQLESFQVKPFREGKNPCKTSEISLKFVHHAENSAECSLLIAADGIYSKVLHETRQKIENPLDFFSLRYLGVIVILGIAPCEHFLVKNRVFQTRDGSTRLFAMPFSATNPLEAIMWQISFPLNENEAKSVSKNASALKSLVLSRCQDWHAPIPEFLHATKEELIMGTPVYDRNPLNESLLSYSPSSSASSSSAAPAAASGLEPHTNSPFPVVFIGDSAHPMSPFKGQGANQALLDAVSLADFLEKAAKGKISFQQALKDFSAEMFQRTCVKVFAARSRVEILHSDVALLSDFLEPRGISNPILLSRLKQLGITANSGALLDDLVLNVIRNADVLADEK